MCSREKAMPVPSRAQRFLYGSALGRIILRILVRPALSRFVGRFMDSRASTPLISRFVKKNGIDLSAFEGAPFASYNAFFTRRIRHELRPICADDDALISPCDARLSAYTVTQNGAFSIKGVQYTLGALLNDEMLADSFIGGLCLVFRLDVSDYHRYCYIDDAHKGENTRIPGVLHTVHPIALSRYDIYRENAREYATMATRHFGTVVQIEVGAMMVGRIVNHHGACAVSRGEEAGYFEFGGSTVVLLISSGQAEPDGEFFDNTENGYETIVRYGEKIGVRKHESEQNPGK
ncbi:MAG: phosphatidylserine decarboxylase [Clostridia bacterium]